MSNLHLIYTTFSCTLARMSHILMLLSPRCVRDCALHDETGHGCHAVLLQCILIVYCAVIVMCSFVTRSFILIYVFYCPLPMVAVTATCRVSPLVVFSTLYSVKLN